MARKTGLVSAFVAGENIKEFRFVGISADFTVTHATAIDNGVAIGVTLGAADEGESVDVDTTGIVQVEVGEGGIEAGAPIKPDEDGKAVALEEDDKVYAIALEDGSAGTIISAKLR